MSFIDFLTWLLNFLRRRKKPPSPAVITQVVLNKKGTNIATSTLTWTVPTTRTDGTQLTALEIDHQDVFDSGTMIGTLQGAANTFTTGVLTTGIHNFTVTVTDTTGHTSAPSNTATVTVPVTLQPPSAIM